jgi:hypothetical protein
MKRRRRYLVTDRISPQARAVVGNALYLLAMIAGPLAVGAVSLLVIWLWVALGLPS